MKITENLEFVERRSGKTANRLTHCLVGFFALNLITSAAIDATKMLSHVHCSEAAFQSNDVDIMDPREPAICLNGQCIRRPNTPRCDRLPINEIHEANALLRKIYSKELNNRLAGPLSPNAR